MLRTCVLSWARGGLLGSVAAGNTINVNRGLPTIRGRKAPTCTVR